MFRVAAGMMSITHISPIVRETQFYLVGATGIEPVTPAV